MPVPTRGLPSWAGSTDYSSEAPQPLHRFFHAGGGFDRWEVCVVAVLDHPAAPSSVAWILAPKSRPGHVQAVAGASRLPFGNRRDAVKHGENTVLAVEEERVLG